MGLSLEFKDVGKAYRSQVLFEHVNLKVAKGEIIGIRGPSGTGKSTLLKMAAGLVRPSWGLVDTHSQRIGYVFQEPRLLPWYTAFDNIRLPLAAIGVTKRQASKKAMKYLEEMGLAGFEQHYPNELSGGMKQRVAIARALAVEPGLLLLDEPFTGLDPVLRKAIKTLVSAALKKSAAGVIHVTHATDELMDATQQVYTLCSESFLPDHAPVSNP